MAICVGSRRLSCAAAVLLLGASLAGCRSGSFPVSEAPEDDPPGVILLDLVDRARAGTVRLSHVGEHFDGGDGTPTDGWSAPQTIEATDLSVAWVTGREATARLDRDGRAVRWLHLRCQAVPSATPATQRMTVAVDDVELGAVDLAADRFEVHSFRLPVEIAARESVVVSLAFSRTAPAIFRLVPSPGRPVHEGRPDVAAACDYLALTDDRDPPEPWQSSRVLGDYGPRGDRLLQPSGTEAAFRLSVPLAGLLEFGVQQGEALSADPESTLRAVVAIRRPGFPEETLFDTAIPTVAARWRADLSSVAGQEVDLVFRITGGGPLGRAAEWLAPRVHGDPGDTDTTTNVVLIVADTLRADHLGSYGGSARTPNLDALAASGVRFQNAYSHAPITVPSHSSMFTSLLPTEHGVLNNGYVLGDLHVTLPELLRANWRHTAAFISLGVLRSSFGLAQGFHEYHEQFGGDWWKTAEEVNAEVLPWLDGRLPEPFFLWAHYSDPHAPYAAPGRAFPTVQVRPGAEPVTAVLNGRSNAWPVDVPAAGLELTFSSADPPLPGIRIVNPRTLDPRITVACASRCRESPVGRRSRRFEVEFPASIRLRNATDETISTHVTFQASDRPSNEEVRHRYREEVEYLDRQIGVLLAALREATEPENTLIIFTADHGEELFEHGPAGHVPYLYDTVLRVPLFVSWPGSLAAGTVVDDVVSHIDLLPTVLEWLRIPDEVARSGRSLDPLLARLRDSFSDEPVVAETFRPEAPVDLKALIWRRQKLIFTPAEDAVQLFDLVRDPQETTDLAAQDRDAAADLTERLETQLDAARQRAIPPEERALTEEEAERLRALGYLR